MQPFARNLTDSADFPENKIEITEIYERSVILLANEMNFSSEEARELLDSFILSIPAFTEKFDLAYESNDYHTMSMLAHQIKGVSSNLRLPELQGICTRLETAIKETDITVHKEVAHLKIMLKKFLFIEGGDKMIKVLIVDDMKILRDCLRIAIEKEPGFTVVGCAKDGKEAVEMSLRLIPDIILMDLNMPVYSGFDAIRDIKALNGNIKILVLTGEDGEKNMTAAFKNGADGYVLKDIDAKSLSAVMSNAYYGEEYVHESAFSIGKKAVKTDPRKPMPFNVTAREQEVLQLVIEGMTNDEISSV